MARNKTEKPPKEVKLKAPVNSKVSAALYDLLRSFEAELASREHLKAKILSAVAFTYVRADLEETALKSIKMAAKLIRTHLDNFEETEFARDVTSLVNDLEILADPERFPDLTAMILRRRFPELTAILLQGYKKSQPTRSNARPALRLVK